MSIFGQKKAKMTPKRPKKPKIQRKRSDTIIALMLADHLKIVASSRVLTVFEQLRILLKITKISKFT